MRVNARKITKSQITQREMGSMGVITFYPKTCDQFFLMCNSYYRPTYKHLISYHTQSSISLCQSFTFFVSKVFTRIKISCHN